MTDYAKNGAAVGGGASLSDATPAALGTAAAGVSTSASRADHVHEAPAGGGTHTSGLRASRPAGAAGDSYYATDEGVLYQRDAAGWRAVSVDIFESLIASARLAFDFDEATGASTIANAGAAGSTLSKSGSPVVEAASALHGRALRCPTSSDYYAGLDGETVGAAWTLEAWVQGTGSGLQTVLARRLNVGAWSAPYVAALLGLSGSQLRVAVGLQGHGDATASISGSLLANGWTHIAGTWDGTTLSGYINGALATAISAAGTIATNSSGRWGVGQIPQGGAANEPYLGRIQAPRYYNACLSADDILRRYARAVGMWKGTP